MNEFSAYPDSIDTSTELPKATDNVTPVRAEIFNRLRDAVLALEKELGIQPSSTYSTVKDRIDAIEGRINDIGIIGPQGPPGPAGADGAQGPAGPQGTPGSTDAVPLTRQVIAGAGMIGGGLLSSDITLNIANTDGSITINPNDIQVGIISDIQHGTRGGGTTHAVADDVTNGFLSASDYTLLHNAFVQGGNSFFTDATLGTLDGGYLFLITQNIPRIYITPGTSADGAVGIGNYPLARFSVTSENGSNYPIAALQNTEGATYLSVSAGSPEGVVGGSRGDMVFETFSGGAYLKVTGALGANTGWAEIGHKKNAVFLGGQTFGTGVQIGSLDAQSFSIVTGGANRLFFEGAGAYMQANTPILLPIASVNMMVRSATSSTVGNTIDFQKNRSNLIVQSGDELGTINFYGYDGSNYQRAAKILATVGATPGASDMPGNLSFWTTPDGSATALQRLTILESGLTGIGQTVPTTKLHVRNDSNSSVFVTHIENQSNGSTSYGLRVTAGNNSGSGTSQMIALTRPDGTVIGTVTQASATTVAYNTSSDQRLKSNIRNTSVGLQKILNVRVRDFEWNDSTEVSTGFIAQELWEIFPEVVTVGGENPKTEPWGIDCSKLVPALVSAIQELAAEIELLKSKNNSNV